MKDEVSVPVRKEHLDRLEEMAKATGVPVEKLLEKALAEWLETNQPPKN